MYNKVDLYDNYNCIAILGGTFNPIHKGHIMLVKEVLTQFTDIEQLFVIPNNMPAYKETDDIISSTHRLNMLDIATMDIPKTIVSDMEIKRGGITYTIDTLNEIINNNPKIKIYFIIGADSLYNLEKWKNYGDIFKKCTFIAAKRACDMKDIISFSNELAEKYPDFKVEFLQTNSIDISSSKLREDIKNGILSDKYLDNNIVNYIKTNKLYGWKE